MKDIMLADEPIESRKDILKDSCDQIVEKSYTRKFDQGEINDRRAEVCEVANTINELEKQLAEFRADIKGRIKPLAERMGNILGELKAGGEYITGECYKFVDDEEGKVGFYTPEGYKIDEREMTQEERQRNLFRALRSAANQ